VSVVIGQLQREDGRFAYWHELQAAQRSISICNVIRVEASPFALKSDGLHLNTAGQVALGRALATALATAQWAECDAKR
jgi:lysophospholipase L1-like esterase